MSTNSFHKYKIPYSNYQLRSIGCLPRTIILLLIASIFLKLIYHRMNRDHQYENEAILPKTNIVDEIKEEPEIATDPKKFEVRYLPTTASTKIIPTEEMRVSVNGNSVLLIYLIRTLTCPKVQFQ